jgi:hypothetical protein
MSSDLRHAAKRVDVARSRHGDTAAGVRLRAQSESNGLSLRKIGT